MNIDNIKYSKTCEHFTFILAIVPKSKVFLNPKKISAKIVVRQNKLLNAVGLDNSMAKTG